MDKAHLLRLGDSIKLGVPIVGTKVEYEYILVRQRLEDIKPYLVTGPSEGACAASRIKKTKRKFNSELEPSTSSKSKLYRHSATDKSQGQACPTDEPRDRPGTRVREEAGPSMRQHRRLDSPLERPSSPSRNLSSLEMYVWVSCCYIHNILGRFYIKENMALSQLSRSQSSFPFLVCTDWKRLDR